MVQHQADIRTVLDALTELRADAERLNFVEIRRAGEARTEDGYHIAYSVATQIEYHTGQAEPQLMPTFRQTIDAVRRSGPKL